MSEDKRLNKVIRVQKRPNNYVMMDKSFLENEALSWKAKGILAYLLSKPNNWKVIVKDLVNHSTDGKSAIYNGLNELKKLGYYEKIPVRDGKGIFIRWESTVYESPVAVNPEISASYPLSNYPEMDNPEMGNPKMENPEMENPEMENPDLDNPFLENRERSNNYLSNIDFNNNYVSESAPAPMESTYGEFMRVRLTAAQYEALLLAFGTDKAEYYITRLDCHIASTGKNYGDHYATLKKWIAEDNHKAKSLPLVTPQPKKNRFCNYSQRTHDYNELERMETEYLKQSINNGETNSLVFNPNENKKK